MLPSAPGGLAASGTSAALPAEGAAARRRSLRALALHGPMTARTAGLLAVGLALALKGLAELALGVIQVIGLRGLIRIGGLRARVLLRLASHFRLVGCCRSSVVVLRSVVIMRAVTHAS